jgi:type 2 lantibiotic biosynthesis protein LanM
MGSTLDAGWYNALTLVERIELLRQSTPAFDETLAEKRVQRWQTVASLTDEERFAKRLNTEQISPQEFRQALGTSSQTLQQLSKKVPDWLNELMQSFASDQPISQDFFRPPTEAEATREQTNKFLFAVAPIIRRAHERLQQGIDAIHKQHEHLASEHPPFNAQTVASILYASPTLPSILLTLINRTMVLELNVARLQNRLQGETPEERFGHFIDLLRTPDEALRIFLEYPVLARHLVDTINDWVDFNLEFLTHLAADWAELKRTFGMTDANRLKRVIGGVGDIHRGGRSVLVVVFEGSDQQDIQIVYKPKSMSVDQHFQEMLEWLNARGDFPPFRTMTLINRGTYGWSEFINATPCQTGEELHRFYQRQGAYLALLYALEAVDFHFENLIASGEHPMLIDLEALFHPHVDVNSNGQVSASQVANELVAYSVLRVGLLPHRVWSNDQSSGIDISGLGAVGGQLTPHAIPYWEASGTDVMHIDRKRMPIPDGRNRPTLLGQPVNVLDYTDAVSTGFEKMYRLLLTHREELFNGPLLRFADNEIRVILRPTRTYGMMQYESFHPDLLRNALDRDRFFDRLWSDYDRRPFMAAVIPSERMALSRGDIPMFTTRPNSRAVFADDTHYIENFFDQTGLELVKTRLALLSNEDLARQQWFIQTSFSTLVISTDHAEWHSYPLEPSTRPVNTAELLRAACAVGDRLDLLALRNDQEAIWIGISLINERSWSLLPLTADLYNGLPGVILFLAYLGSVTGQEKYTELARAALTTTRRQVDEMKDHVHSLGTFDGLGSYVVMLTHLGVLWNDDNLLDDAVAFVSTLTPLINEDKSLDIIGGSAGAILTLLNLYSVRPATEVLDAAIAAGDYLLSRAVQRNGGMGWETHIAARQPLAGFSHGASGMATALLQLGAVTHDERYINAARQALQYERQVFSPEALNWPDFRLLDENPTDKNSTDTTTRYMHAWCHGAPGVGLARVRMLESGLVTDLRDMLQEDLRHAVQCTLMRGFGTNHSLCHGDFGNVEMIVRAGDVLGDASISEKGQRVVAMLLDSIDKYGWLCGVPRSVETPGLMTGLAGIGYQLLRLAMPHRIPSILTLDEPPHAAQLPQSSVSAQPSAEPM